MQLRLNECDQAETN